MRGETKILKKDGKLDQEVGALKRQEGAGTPLRVMLFMHLIFCLNVLKETLSSKQESNDRLKLCGNSETLM